MIQSSYSSSAGNRQHSWFSRITFSKQDLLPSSFSSGGNFQQDPATMFERQKVQTAMSALISVVTFLRHVTKSSSITTSGSSTAQSGGASSIPKDIQIPVMKSLTTCFCKSVDLLRLLISASITPTTGNTANGAFVTEQEVAKKILMEMLISNLHNVADNTISTFYNLLLAFDDRTKEDFANNNAGLKLVLQQAYSLPVESFSKLVAQWICDKMNVKL